MKKLLSIVLLFGLFFTARGQSKNELEQKKESTLQELNLARELLEKTQNKRENTMKRVSLLNKGISSRETMISTIQNELDLVEEEIESLESEISMLEKQIKKGREEYAEILYSIYKNHTEEEKMMYLLASEDINQFYQRVKYLKYLKNYREKKIEELEDMILQKEKLTGDLLKSRNEKAGLLKEKEDENRELVRERDDRNRLVRQLSQDERRIQREIAEKEKIRKELEDKITKIIEEEARKRSSTNLASSLTPEQRLLGNNFLQNKGRLPWPVERGVITADFGLINHPVLAGVKINNNGIDISTNPGHKARAVFDGEVTSVFAILGANYAVIIMHGEYLSVYQNLVDLKVKGGDRVVTKQELGTIHADPNEDVAVLQFQVWKSKEILDPKMWLSK